MVAPCDIRSEIIRLLAEARMTKTFREDEECRKSNATKPPQACRAGRRWAAALALLATGAARPVLAQSFPTRAIQLIVPFAAGGGVDVVTRVVAEAAGDIIKQRFVIENRGGAGTVLGSQAVAKAEPDGYTLLAAPTTMVINPALRSNLPFDWKTDLVPVAMIATLPFVVSAGLKLPVKTMKELEALGKPVAIRSLSVRAAPIRWRIWPENSSGCSPAQRCSMSRIAARHPPSPTRSAATSM
jgi:hypothetical protein